MKWNSDKMHYEGETSDGNLIVVEGDEYAESLQDGVDEDTLSDPDMWQTCIGANQNVYYVDEQGNEIN